MPEINALSDCMLYSELLNPQPLYPALSKQADNWIHLEFRKYSIALQYTTENCAQYRKLLNISSILEKSSNYVAKFHI